MSARYNNQKHNFIKENVFAIILFVVIAVIFFWGLNDAYTNRAGEELRLAEESISRAVVSCYAIEGSYPDSYQYIKDNYGVRINEKKYLVMYEIFASNIMPEITVLERQEKL